MPLTDYLIGAVLIAWVWGGCLAMGFGLVRAFADNLSGSTRATAVGVFATGALILVHVVPGMLTLLYPGVVAAATAVGLLLTWLAVRRRHGLRADRDPVLPAPDSPPLAWALAGLALLALAGRALANVWGSRLLPPYGEDLNGIHLPTVASWIQTHSIWGNHEFEPFFAAGNYTQNVDISYLSTMLPLHQDVFARVGVLPWYGFLALTVYAFARELHAPRAVALMMGTTVLAIRVVGSTAIAYSLPDAQTLACLAAGALFLGRHMRTRSAADLAVAGVALGVTFGGKWYGVGAVAVLGIGWLVVRVVRRENLPRVARDAVVLGLWVLLLGAVWMVRNWVAAGDPLFPLDVKPLGISIFDAPPDPVRDAFGGKIADYFGNWDIIRHVLIPSWHKAFGTPGALIGLLGLGSVGLWIADLRRKRMPSPALPMAYVGAALCAAVYTITPYSALGTPGNPLAPVVFGNSRYVTPALVLLAAPAAWLVGRMPRWAMLAVQALAAVIVVTASRKSLIDPDAFAPSSHTVEFAAALVLAGGAVLLARSLMPARMHHLIAIAAILLAGSAIVVAGRRAQRTEASVRYPSEQSIAALQIVPGHPKVALAGYWDTSGIQMTYPAFGPRLRSRVKYIGHYFHGGLRPASREQYIRALRTGRYTVLAIGRYQLPVSPRQPLVAWARQAGWTVAVTDPRTILMIPPKS